MKEALDFEAEENADFKPFIPRILKITSTPQPFILEQDLVLPPKSSKTVHKIINSNKSEDEVNFIEPIIDVETARDSNFEHAPAFHKDNLLKPNFNTSDLPDIIDRCQQKAILKPTITSRNTLSFELYNTSTDPYTLRKGSPVGLFSTGFISNNSIEACRYQQHLNSVDNHLKEKFDDIKRTVYSPCSTQPNFSSFPLASEEKHTRSPDEIYQAMLQKRKWYLNNRADDFPKKLVTTPDDTTKSIKVNL